MCIAIPRGALFEKDGRRIVYCPPGGPLRAGGGAGGTQQRLPGGDHDGPGSGRPRGPPRSRRRRRRRALRGATGHRGGHAVIEVREALATGAASLRFHALRSFLAMLGIIFGVGAVIAMLSIGAGAEREALALIDAMGLRNVIVRAKDPERENDRQEMRRKSPGLASTGRARHPRGRPGCRERGLRGAGGDLEGPFRHGAGRSRRCKACPTTSRASMPVALREGRFFDRKDEETYAPPSCVIGSRGAARPLRVRGRPRAGRSRSTTSG